ncbi:MAG: TetR/AcrR family transcriptional regulator, partial [Alcaligenes sp.]
EPLHRILSEGQNAGVWSVADVDLTAWVIYQGMHGAVDNMGLETAEQWAALEDNLVTLFVSMLGAKLPHPYK